MQGFQAQGNEFSYFMLLASAYLLNGVERAEQVGRREAGERSVVRGTKHKASRSPACALHCFALVLPPVPTTCRIRWPTHAAVDHSPLVYCKLQPADGGRSAAGRADPGRVPRGAGACPWLAQHVGGGWAGGVQGMAGRASVVHDAATRPAHFLHCWLHILQGDFAEVYASPEYAGVCKPGLPVCLPRVLRSKL